MSRKTLYAIVFGLAAALLYLGVKSFVTHFPKNLASQTSEANPAIKTETDTLFQFITTAMAFDSAQVTTDSVTEENPFRSARPIRITSSPSSRPKPNPPLRKFILRGTVGSDVATITDQTGHKRIVKIGDAIDSAEVVSIEPNKVVLKDRAGKFELIQEK